MTQRLMFRLLPAQVLLFVVTVSNALVDTLYASNFIGTDAMSAIGLYAPISAFLGAVNTLIIGGTADLCSLYLGTNRTEKAQGIFSLNMVLTAAVSVVITLVLAVMAFTGASAAWISDEAVRRTFNMYLLGQVIGTYPLLMGSQLSVFLMLENKVRRAVIAGISYFALNTLCNALFVVLLHMGVFGLALSTSLGLWAAFLIEASFFRSERAHFHYSAETIPWRAVLDMLQDGATNATSQLYKTIQSTFFNQLVLIGIGMIGLSAVAAVDSVVRVLLAVPSGMLAVSRMLISISAGEQDKESLSEIARSVLRGYLPLISAIGLLLIVFAEPLTRLFYRDPTAPVYTMTLWGFRILPLLLPLTMLYEHYAFCQEALGRMGLVQFTNLLRDMVIAVMAALILVRPLGITGIYLAPILGAAGALLALLFFACYENKTAPRGMETLLAMPEGFGVPESRRLDLRVETLEDVVSISDRTHRFLREQGVEERRAFLGGLFLEEMAGNVVKHGFTKDNKSHVADVRVVCGKDVILRIKDDAVPFDPAERMQMLAGKDRTKNIGIRMIYGLTEDVRYQNILGLNALTARLHPPAEAPAAEAHTDKVSKA